MKEAWTAGRACSELSASSPNRRRDGGNVEIAPKRDFQGRWEGRENLKLVFLAFHGASFPRSPTWTIGRAPTVDAVTGRAVLPTPNSEEPEIPGASHIWKIIAKPCAGRPHARFGRG